MNVMSLSSTFHIVALLAVLFINVGYAKKNFKVCNVTKGNRRFVNIGIETASKSIEDSLKIQGATLKYEIGNANHQLVDPQFGFKNSLLAAALTAYNNHLPLELSVDDIWTLIAYGVAQHLGADNYTSEYYRKVFVDHEGRKELSISGDQFGLQPGNLAANKLGYPKAIEEFSRLIKNNTRTNVAEIMSTPFSTTGPIEQTVFNCMLMDAMKNYFSYKITFLCGIPDITLHGTTADWSSVVDRIEKLKKIFPDFEWYLNRVKTNVLIMLDTVSGNKIDLNWWNTMIFDVPLGSGSDRKFTGWLGDFFPYQYSSKNKERRKNLGKFNVLFVRRVTYCKARCFQVTSTLTI